jgi:hypothetical protein
MFNRAMFDLIIDRLQMNITNAAGHEYRLQPIALLALDLLAARLEQRGWNRAGGRIDNLDVPTVRLDLNRMSDAEAAQAIADAWLEALALKLRS